MGATAGPTPPAGPASIEEDHGEAAASSGTPAAALPQLPTDMLGAVVKAVPRQELAALRLVSQQFAAAIDPLAHSVSFRAWEEAAEALPLLHQARLRHVHHVSMQLRPPPGGGCRGGSAARGGATGAAGPEASTACAGGLGCDVDWARLEQLAAALPLLDSLSLPCWGTAPAASACLTRLTRLELDEPGVLPSDVSLPGLRAAAFLSSEAPADLAAIAALAPNLEQLACRRLEIGGGGSSGASGVSVAPAAPAAGPAAAPAPAQAAAAAAAAEPLLPRCMHFGGQAVHVPGATGPAQAAAALGAALPALAVLFHVPQVFGGAGKAASYDELLAALPGLRAVRGRNWFSSRSWLVVLRSSGALASERWRRVRRLAFHSNSYPDGCTDFLDISRSCGELAELRLTFNYPFTKAEELVRELAALPSLRRLALPAALLCPRCCPDKHYPGLRESLNALVVRPALAELDLLTLPEDTPGGNFFCGHAHDVQQGMSALAVRAATARHQQCRKAAAAAAVATEVAAAEDGGAKWPEGPAARPPADLRLKLHVEDPAWGSASFLSGGGGGGHEVWGAFVAPSEW